MSYAKRVDQFTLRELAFGIFESERHLTHILKDIVNAGGIFHVGNDVNKFVYNIKNIRYTPEMKRTSVTTKAPKNRPMIKASEKTLVMPIRANQEAVDRFYLGTQCRARV